MIVPRYTYPFLLIGALAIAGTACGNKDNTSTGETPAAGQAGGGGTPPAMSGAKAQAEAKKVFQQRCSICHGESGKGDGPGAAALDPKPRDYTDKAWQAQVTDEDLKKVILGGGAAVGKSATMAPNPDLGKPDKAAVLDELIKIIRSFGS